MPEPIKPLYETDYHGLPIWPGWNDMEGEESVLDLMTDKINELVEAVNGLREEKEE